MPATWVQADNTTWWGWSHVADCGVYTGPNHPDAPVWMPADVDEIDFYIGPASTGGDPLLFAPTDPVIDVYRYRTGTSEATGTYYPEDPDPAWHLYLVAWSNDFPSEATPDPSLDPLSLVPPGYVDGAHGPYRAAGHWSDWIEYGTRSFEATVEKGFLNAAQYESPASADVATTMAAQQAALQSGSTRNAESPRGAYAAFSFFFAQVDNEIGGSPPNPHFAESEIDQGFATITASDHSTDLDPSPPFLDTLVFGVDYGIDPDSGNFVEYESDTATVTGWADWTVTANVQPFQPNGQGDNIPGTGDEFTPTEYNVPFRFAILDPVSFPSGNNHGDAIDWLSYTDGTTIYTYTPHATADVQSYSGESITLPLADVSTAMSWSLVVQPETLGPADQPIPNFTLTGDQFQAYWVLSQLLDIPAIDPNDPGFSQPPSIVYQQPQFRYWVLGAVVGIPIGIHTVGGHWAVPGGVEVRMLQTDGTWLPILDGTA